MICTENNYHVRVSLLDEIYVLSDRVGRSSIPILLRRAHLCRDRNNKVVPKETAYFPALAQMLQQRLTLELRKNVDGINTRVDEIAQDEVDDSVAAPKRYCRFCPFLSQRIKARSLSACEHKRENPKLHADRPPPISILENTSISSHVADRPGGRLQARRPAPLS